MTITQEQIDELRSRVGTVGVINRELLLTMLDTAERGLAVQDTARRCAERFRMYQRHHTACANWAEVEIERQLAEACEHLLLPLPPSP